MYRRSRGKKHLQLAFILAMLLVLVSTGHRADAVKKRGVININIAEDGKLTITDMFERPILIEREKGQLIVFDKDGKQIPISKLIKKLPARVDGLLLFHRNISSFAVKKNPHEWWYDPGHGHPPICYYFDDDWNYIGPCP